MKRKFIKISKKIKKSEIDSVEIKSLLDFDLKDNNINCFKKNSLHKKIKELGKDIKEIVSI